MAVPDAHENEGAFIDPVKPAERSILRAFDLVMILGWSEFPDLRMVVELDNSIGGEVYQEVLVFYPSGAGFRRWTMWRSNEHIVVQTTVGRTMHFTSVAGALDSLIPVADEAAGLNAA